ncbi:hypothetical protein [Paragemmobacter straminiformis]|uniref:Uncharacterized protein n=1 Tax=Paragemmobacter straminiformis TaxID=2045119 RepID=A0A842I4J9_9RHOB|nr:hypothetical protein [Gemmobacter straminiformis]MBC2834064.1 hypothetical protein [Gemmobacter straminiformis]
MEQLNLVEIQKALDENPIFHMSLSSRELFHSNFLAWLFWKYPASLNAVLPLSFSVSNISAVHRERKNLDLLIEAIADSGLKHNIVLENKVKDIPRAEQLLSYDEKLKGDLGNAPTDKILLSLVPAAKSVKEKSGWLDFDYKSLGSNVLDWVDRSAVSDEDVIIIRLYGELVCNLSKLVDASLQGDGLPRESWLLKTRTPRQDEIHQVLSDLRLIDMIGKMQASFLLDSIRAEVGRNFRSTTFEVEFGSGYSRAMPMVEASISRAVSGGSLSLGVQVQGDQYRRFILFAHFNIPPKESARKKISQLRKAIDETDGYRWLFAPEVEKGGFITALHEREESLLPKKMGTRMDRAAPINSFAPGFVYQHIDLDSLGSSQDVFASLPAIVVSDLSYASSLLGDPDYLEKFINFRSISSFN